jgi:hypothetical protein
MLLEIFNKVELFCNHCFKKINIKPKKEGAFIKCSHCKNIMTVFFEIKKGINTYHIRQYNKVA